MKYRLIAWLKKQICSWFHGGGQLHHDELGRLNWRCSKCKRWSDDPLPPTHY